METQRLEARLAAPQKEMIQQAAALLGRTVTDFVVTAAYERALETKLNASQGKAFVEALLAKSPPVNA